MPENCEGSGPIMPAKLRDPVDKSWCSPPDLTCVEAATCRCEIQRWPACHLQVMGKFAPGDYCTIQVEYYQDGLKDN